MKKILVTGVTGVIGKRTVEHLLEKGVPASQIVGLSRNKEKSAELLAKGIEVRLGDYSDYNSLLEAFEGVDKVMLTSATAFSDRNTQHFNAITAARQAGVRHVVYMSIIRKEGSERIMPEITESDLFTEQVLKSSGLDYTILYHPPFTDILSIYYDSDPYRNGIKVPANNGKMAPATRNDLAEAHAVILSTPGHEKKTYILSGSESLSFSDIAKIITEVTEKNISFTSISAEEYVDKLINKGVPRHVAEFLKSWVVAIDEGEFEGQSNDLERLINRKPITFREYTNSILAQHAVSSK